MGGGSSGQQQQWRTYESKVVPEPPTIERYETTSQASQILFRVVQVSSRLLCLPNFGSPSCCAHMCTLLVEQFAVGMLLTFCHDCRCPLVTSTIQGRVGELCMGEIPSAPLPFNGLPSIEFPGLPLQRLPLFPPD
jgi:hypothetical protein